ncbi:hypothetical protein U0070_011961, partial [Myodes glareolus]
SSEIREGRSGYNRNYNAQDASVGAPRLRETGPAAMLKLGRCCGPRLRELVELRSGVVRLCTVYSLKEMRIQHILDFVIAQSGKCSASNLSAVLLLEDSHNASEKCLFPVSRESGNSTSSHTLDY